MIEAVPQDRVLIIDSPHGALHDFAPILLAAGFQVETLEDKVGLTPELLALSTPSLVLLNRLDGLSPASIGGVIRALRRTMRARTVFVAKGTPEVLESQAATLGADVSVDLGELSPPPDEPAPRDEAPAARPRLLPTNQVTTEGLRLHDSPQPLEPQLLAGPRPQSSPREARLLHFVREQLRQLRATIDQPLAYSVTLDILTESNVYLDESGRRPLGLFVAAVPPAEVGAAVELTVQLPWGDRLSAPARVEWTQGHTALRPSRREGFGARLDDLAGPLGRALERFGSLRAPLLNPRAVRRPASPAPAPPPLTDSDQAFPADSAFVSAGSLSRLIDQAPVGFLLFDGQGVVVGSNAAFRNFLGAEAEPPDGRVFVDLVHPEDLTTDPDFASELRQIVSGEREVLRRELRLVGTTGRVLWVKLCVVRIRGTAGPASCGLALVENVTDQKLVLRELLLVDRMASAGILAAGAAHRINNPLSYLRSSLEFVSSQLSKNPRELDAQGWGALDQALSDGLQGTAEIAAVVRDLGIFTSVASTERRLIAVCPVLDRAVEALAPKFKRRVRFTRNYQSTPSVRASESELQQVFANVLLNAAHAAATGAADADREIGLAVSAVDAQAVIEIRDSGGGFEPRYLDRVFLPFESTRKQADTGLGLGLFVCRSIIQELGGQISVESVTGVGSTVRFLIPLGVPA